MKLSLNYLNGLNVDSRAGALSLNGGGLSCAMLRIDGNACKYVSSTNAGGPNRLFPPFSRLDVKLNAYQKNTSARYLSLHSATPDPCSVGSLSF